MIYTNRTQYYEAMKRLADEKRQTYGLATEKLGLQKMREIYKAEGITIDLWKTSARIRAIYMCDGGDPSVLVNRSLPDAPRLFAMAHELKHHYCDQHSLKNGEIRCGDYNANEVIEKAAEVFAAEFVYPEKDFLQRVADMGLERGNVTPERVVELKRSCGSPVSYTFLQKRLEWFKFIQNGEFAKIQFQKLEEQLYGVPIYRQAWFKARRGKRQS
jgi:Zn-dependent peptidase ImmA (M78 family)